MDYLHGPLNWGLFLWLNGVSTTVVWWPNLWRMFANPPVCTCVEWGLHEHSGLCLMYMLYLCFNMQSFQCGKLSTIIMNGLMSINLKDLWKNRTQNVAPFDQVFYLVMNVTIGGTNSRFLDGVGDNRSLSACTVCAVHT